MKHIKYFILIILLIPINCFAIDFYCSTKVKSSSEFTCTLSSSSNTLASLTATLDLPSELLIKNINVTKGYNSVGDYKNLSFTGPGYNAPNSIAIFTIIAPTLNADKTYTISLNNISYKYLKNDKNVSTENTKTATIKILKTNQVTEPTTIITTEAVTEKTSKINEEAKISFDLNGAPGNIPDMKCLIQDGKCSIDITNLESPRKEGYIFRFWSLSNNCKDKINNNLEVNGNTTLYACYYQEDHVVNPNYLNTLNITDQIINFTKFNFEYSFNVNNEVTSLEIEAIAENENAIIEISPNASNLLEGKNTIYILVIENNMATSYKLNVNRNSSSKIYDKNFIPYLDNLEVEGYQINFDKETYFYNLKVKYNTKSLKILPVLDDNNLQYEIIGNNDLTDGGNVQINISSPNGVTTHYIIIVTYESFIKTYSTYIYVVILIVFCLIVYLIVNSQMNKRKKSNRINKAQKNTLNNNKKTRETVEILKL